MTFVPTLAQEVERKAIDTLERIANDLELGKISKAQYLYALDILWSASAGIAGDDFMIMMETAKLPNRDREFVTRSYFQSNSGKIVRITNSMTGFVVVDVDLGFKKRSRKLHSFKEDVQPTKKALEKIEEIESTLLKKGFVKI